ncbi:MAG: OmpA family protein [Bacteroidia bacterium]|nr:OmpA family protein [Bacteroidia bacterium]
MKLIKSFLLLLNIVIFGSVSAQKIQWASKVVSFSSQFSKTNKSANEILGKYNSLPTGGDSPLAWAVKAKGNDESPDPAFIRVAYDSPMRVQQVAVGESNNPGAITKITLFGAEGEEKIIYEGKAAICKQKARMVNIILDQPTSFFVSEIAVNIEPASVPGWNQLDAIGISDTKDSIRAFINVVPNLVFESEPENLGNEINSIYDELAPMISPDGRTLFFDRKFHPDNIGGFKDADDIWLSARIATGKKINPDTGEEDETFGWSKASNIGPPLNTKLNNYVQGITPDGNCLVLANVYNKDGTQEPGVSFTYKEVQGWSYPEKQQITDFYNLNKKASYYLSNDGKFLLMSIERKDSYGNLDLYVCERKGENRWSKPKNLGKILNTTQNDYSPFLAADGVTLFYSTSGHSGYGNDDIFMTIRQDDTWENWSEPQNLGNKLNTPDADSKYNIPASGEYAYYSSRSNSMGENDIFRIKLPSVIKPKPVVLVTGRVLNERNNKPVGGVKIIYEILPGGEEAGIARSDPKTGEYKIVLPAGKTFGFRALAAGFYSQSANLDLTELKEYAEVEKDLKIAPIEVGMVITLNNIFFEFAKAILRPESFPELERVFQFMVDNPALKVEISGHTDDVGSDETNNKLSKNRAQAVTDYLVKSGIDPNRIITKGYGETRPVAFNNTEEGRQMNRRVEFKILSK